MKFHLKNLDSIRTLAFLSTFLAHAFYSVDERIYNHEIFVKVNSLRDLFGFGVPVFFVLSGFLITFLMLREYSKKSKISILKFYMRRILRIWPVYYLVVFFGLYLFPIIRTKILGLPYDETANPLMYLFFLGNFDQINNNGILPFGVGLGPTWSVSVEEQFYLVWPILFTLFPFRKLKYLLLLLLIFAIFSSSYFELTNKHTIFCMIYLVVGAAGAYMSYFNSKFSDFIKNLKPIYFVLMCLLLFITVYLLAFKSGGVMMALLSAILIVMIIIYQVFGSRMEFRNITFIENLGKYTYGMYLYHVVCNFIVYSFFDKVMKIEDSLISALLIRPLLSLILTLVISIISYNYFEKIFLNLKSKFSA